MHTCICTHMLNTYIIWPLVLPQLSSVLHLKWIDVVAVVIDAWAVLHSGRPFCCLPLTLASHRSSKNTGRSGKGTGTAHSIPKWVINRCPIPFIHPSIHPVSGNHSLYYLIRVTVQLLHEKKERKKTLTGKIVSLIRLPRCRLFQTATHTSLWSRPVC